jgi:excisionase family DNA binding protein
MKPKFLISDEELGEMTGLSRMTRYRLRASGELPYVKIGSKIGYLPSSIDAWLAERERNRPRARMRAV